jgi:KUP system potassium uptake protein
MTLQNNSSQQDSRLFPLAVAAVGVVYGDVGTSPLYTMKEVFGGIHGVPPTAENVLGILSLVFWSLLIVVSLKYVLFMMRADNRGEGGIIALMALALRASHKEHHTSWLLIMLGLFGAALFYGDGMVTPAISVLSAVEGLKVAAPVLEPYVIPVTIGVLIGLFVIQRRGTGRVGILFGPVMIVWFICLATLGVRSILQTPDVLRAVNPLHGVTFFLTHRWHGFLALGAVVLAITGAEALYADMGHFGRRPIRLAWFCFVLPALLLNYFGQGALISRDPASVANPFYLLAPSWGLYPMIALATLATIIASQAVISGAFSITYQAVQLGYLPRLSTLHTSEHQIGQIYVASINWALFVSVIGLVLGFRSSTNLAAAYGMAITGAMLIDSLLALVVARWEWKWSWLKVTPVIGLFLIVDFAFFGANLVKIPHGGWFTLVIGSGIFFFMMTWQQGRHVLINRRLQQRTPPLKSFLARIGKRPPVRVSGTAIYMTANTTGAPNALLENLKHNKVIHERMILLTVSIEDIPRVSEDERVTVEPFDGNFYRVFVRYGFTQSADIPRALRSCEKFGLVVNMADTSIFLGRETLVPSVKPHMSGWRETLFIFMFRNATSPIAFFKLPAKRVIELGTQIEI